MLLPPESMPLLGMHGCEPVHLAGLELLPANGCDRTFTLCVHGRRSPCCGPRKPSRETNCCPDRPNGTAKGRLCPGTPDQRRPGILRPPAPCGPGNVDVAAQSTCSPHLLRLAGVGPEVASPAAPQAGMRTCAAMLVSSWGRWGLKGLRPRIVLPTTPAQPCLDDQLGQQS